MMAKSLVLVSTVVTFATVAFAQNGIAKYELYAVYNRPMFSRSRE